MGLSVRVCICFLLLYAVVSSAENTQSFSGVEAMMSAIEGRSSEVKLDDYSDPTANRGHDPPSARSSRGGGGNGGSRSRKG